MIKNYVKREIEKGEWETIKFKSNKEGSNFQKKLFFLPFVHEKGR